MEEITIKVPAPFSGVFDLGFTARYPSQDPYAAAADVPFLIEGPPQPMRRLVGHLRMLRQSSGRTYSWTDPVMLSDEVVVMAYRDHSLERESGLEATGVTARDHLQNAVLPVVFPFLQDCATLAGLRLEELIQIRVQASGDQVADLQLRLEQIVQPNGHDLLWSF
ncbi:MAG TPA: hypothetical protein VNG93_00130 [Candidatus Dormibacteraeota bacterium]|nr:hypothetical protein [Candidatus Dormibacteraeota bacterium]